MRNIEQLLTAGEFTFAEWVAANNGNVNEAVEKIHEIFNTSNSFTIIDLDQRDKPERDLIWDADFHVVYGVALFTGTTAPSNGGETVTVEVTDSDQLYVV